jgi:K+-sensing histidine kinase KdpD
MASRRFTAGGSPGRAVLAAVAAPLFATVLAIVLEPDSALGAVPLFLLGVVVAAAVGGVWAGLGSSVLGFLSLNYFFTAPRHTFRVARREDVLALVVFLVVAGVVGWLFARTIEARVRAETREREARLLGYLATKVLSGEPLARVLETSRAPARGAPLARCEIMRGQATTRSTPCGSVPAGARRSDHDHGPAGRVSELDRHRVRRRARAARRGRPAPVRGRPDRSPSR